MSFNHPYSFDFLLTSPMLPGMPLTLDNTPPYTPRSKSLDLLRADAATPINARNSLDTISTLRGHRISSPIFLNSSVGVKPLPEEPSPGENDDADEICSETFNTTRSPSNSADQDHDARETKLRASTMPRYLACDIGFQPKTPSRRQKSDHLLRSKFSMSPVQVSKRSKARTSQDQTRLPEVVVSQDTCRSTLGHWSYSLGVAARKLQKSTLPRKPSDESYKSSTTLDVPQLEVKERLATPEKAKHPLRSATSLASIRRFITPSRRVRKVSTTTRGLTGGRSRPMLTVDDVIGEQGTNSSEDTGGWVDADGRASRDGLTQHKVDPKERGGTPLRLSYLMVPTVNARCTRRALDRPESNRVAARPRAPLSPEFYEPPPQIQPQQSDPQHDVAESVDDARNHDVDHAPTLSTLSNAEPVRQQEQPEAVSTADEQPPAPSAPTSKLRTLQLLARRPFNAFGKKMRETQKSWFPSRTSQDLPTPSLIPAQPNCAHLAKKEAPATRRSEDLLSKASPRICDTSTMAQKSRSVELDRIQLPSKVVPLRPTGGVVYKRRPTIPDAFAKPVPPPPPPPPPTRADVKPQTQSSTQPRISDLRHPWMKQLQLANASSSPIDNGMGELGARQIWPKMEVSPPPSAGIIPTVSLTAASLTLTQTESLVAVPKKESPRRPPASLLGQSLPIPPRCGRSRASTISSQSSTTSSPSGKVIVSRRSYGQRLRSPSTREETGSIRSVGTSILFTESPPGSPGMRKFMSPYYATRSPSAVRIRSPPTTVLLPKYSPRRSGKVHTLHRKPSSAFTDESETEWMDEGPTTNDNGSTAALTELVALRSRLEDVLPPIRPGFLEMNEATHTLSNLVKTFSGSSGSLSLHSSPYKRDTPTQAATPGRGLFGIMEADEATLSYTLSRSPPTHLSSTRTRERLISKVSIVSTEGNSSFEDSEELQKLLDSIMAADLGGSCDTSGSRDMALLSPFGSPAEFRDSRTSDKRLSVEVKENVAPVQKQLPPPPKFLLNDRPISPPDSSCMSHTTHSEHCFGAEDADTTVTHTNWEATTAATIGRASSAMGTPAAAAAAACAKGSTNSWRKTVSGGGVYDDSGYASFSILDSYQGRR
ncbi:uncharacterized protein UTRI_03590_B [Ustilago trichophora]|uniref:Uncharacterized protein n=1 Tax=Ustilago trichophora TaxID=86804 RepID=A0A5C3E059_9BASI|nr:uncharacterized protein UTRI_03590_B [Ustilago trichophora]